MSTSSPPRPYISPRQPPSCRTRRASIALGRYTDHRGDEREVICRPGAGGSALVIDRLTATHDDARLVAHLAADEPVQNAQIVGSLYLTDKRSCRCRRLTEHDLQMAPLFAEETHIAPAREQETESNTARLTDKSGFVYRLESAPSGMSIPELRWRRTTPGRAPEVVSVRNAIASLESYEPVRSITAAALASCSCDPTISTSVLRVELERVDTSPIVLNRGLREAVLAAVGHGASMSEIAIRCGRVKRDARGNTSGETSWLARRIGQLPEGGESTPSPWIHSDTLALIARQGLNIAPREVELG
ncbi:MAG: hypothetical protein ABSG93_08995 [Solirubrobacteraceae bacterium]